MSSSSSARSSSQQRQQWEVAVLTARLPAQMALLVASALLAPGPTDEYATRPWEPLARFSEQIVQSAALGRVRALLNDELHQARCLVWTPLADLCLLKRNAPLAVHAARLAQLAWELERRPGVRAAEEARRAVESRAHAIYPRGKGSA
ncbi:MAG TPA: hypothetical protein VH590_21625 [Ktedonobacterales bacterium]|jgi:hypothetical protein